MRARAFTSAARRALVVATSVAYAAGGSVALSAPAAVPPVDTPPVTKVMQLPASVRALLKQVDVMRETPSVPRQDVLASARAALERAPEHPDTLWRAARAAYDVSELPGTPAATRTALIAEAAAWAGTARALVSSSSEPGLVHRWQGILLSSVAKARGIASYATAVPTFAAEWRRAVEIDPHDAITLHLLGRLHYELAKLTWLERTAAAAIFAAPPPATFEQAEELLLAAERESPGTIKANHLYLAETYARMQRREDALIWVRSGLATPLRTLYDQLSQESLLSVYERLDGPAAAKYRAEHGRQEIVK